jgi:hypothetical protein
MARTVWGRTRCPGGVVTIYVDDDLPDDRWAETDWHVGKCEINFHPRAVKHKKLGQWLLHELVHVVEYLNDPDYMSVEVADDCTPLAKTLERQLWPLLTNLKTTRPSDNPFRSR